jgi:ABC-type proline/glycine betaine transport system permease subunit
VFSTAQELGGAVGVAVLGSVVFAHLAVDHFDAAFKAAVPLTVIAYLVCAGLSCLLPDRAVTDEDVIEAV